MRAQQYLFGNKQLVRLSFVLFAALGLGVSVYGVIGAESMISQSRHTLNNEEVVMNSENSGSYLGQIKNEHSTAVIANVSVKDSSSMSNTSSGEFTVNIIPPATPISPVEPFAPSSHESSSNSTSSHVQSTPHNANISTDTQSENTQDSNVRIRIRDKSQSEVNNQTVENRDGSLQLIVREVTSSQ